jgi:hypothetical protein
MYIPSDKGLPLLLEGACLVVIIYVDEVRLCL